MIRINIELYGFDSHHAQLFKKKLKKKMKNSYPEKYTRITIVDSLVVDINDNYCPFVRIYFKGLDECYRLTNQLPDPLAEIKGLLKEINGFRFELEVFMLQEAALYDN